MRRVDLGPRARDDIISIAAYGIEAFGSAQSHLYQDEMFRQFELLAEFPRLGRPLEPPHTQIHRFGYGSHIILYTITEDGITISARADGYHAGAGRAGIIAFGDQVAESLPDRIFFRPALRRA